MPADPNILAVYSGVKWNSSIVTYAFPDDRNYYYQDNPWVPGFIPTSERQRDAVKHILEGAGASQNFGLKITSVQSVTNIDLIQVDHTSGWLEGQGPGNIKVSNSTYRDSDYGFYPNAGSYAGQVWIAASADGSIRNPAPGNFDYFNLMHELGHALGLKHGHEANDYSGALETSKDAIEYSVMTYRSYIGGDTGQYSVRPGSYAQTLMMYDIAALQYMYGANFNTNSGDTVYSWDSYTGQTFVNGVGQGLPSANKIFLTVWDGGGTDTYDFSNYHRGMYVDLAPGGFSSFSASQTAELGLGQYAQGNVYNALQYNGDPRSLIENAIGGFGQDKISGNDANNLLMGGGLFGNDSLYGGNGDDTLYGGSGDDVLDDKIPNSLQGNYVYGNDLIYGEYGNDQLLGRFGNDTLDGGGDDDYLDAGEDDDVLYGGSGNDFLLGWTGNDMLHGGMGADSFDGGDGWDAVNYVTATAGVKVVRHASELNTGDAAGDSYDNGSIEAIVGSNYDDELHGWWGDEDIYAGEGNDYLNGYQGNDYLAGQGGNDSIHGGSGNDRLHGEAGDDALIGGEGNDSLYGGAGNDYLDIDEGPVGGADWLFGGDGDDTLIGDGVGSVLNGGWGRDTYHIRPWAKTTITDFAAGPDLYEQIIVYKSVFSDYAALMALAYQSGNNVVIEKDGFSLTLADLSLNSLAQNDFVFL